MTNQDAAAAVNAARDALRALVTANNAGDNREAMRANDLFGAAEAALRDLTLFAVPTDTATETETKPEQTRKTLRKGPDLPS